MLGPDGVTEWKGCQAWPAEDPAGGRWAGVPPRQPLSFRLIRWRELRHQEQVGAERAPVCPVGRRARSCLSSGGWGRCWGRPCCQPGTATTAPKLPVPEVVAPGQPPCRGSVAVWMLWAVLSTPGPGPAALAHALRCPCVGRHATPIPGWPAVTRGAWGPCLVGPPSLTAPQACLTCHRAPRTHPEHRALDPWGA